MALHRVKELIDGDDFANDLLVLKEMHEKVFGKVCLDLEEIRTIIPKIEAVLNSRPLTYLYPDSNDSYPLTPSHFLCGGRLTSLPEKIQTKYDVDNPDDPDCVPTSKRSQLKRKNQACQKQHKNISEMLKNRIHVQP